MNWYYKQDKIANQMPQQLVTYLGLGALQGSGLLHDNDAAWVEKPTSVSAPPLTRWQNARCKMLAVVMDF